jgi:MurNAc alpha-1-phosphate uridylyltransferase
MKAMILAAGFGKRLMPLTENLPKPLLKVGDQTLIERNINYLINNGFSEIIINASHHGDLLIEHVNDIFSDHNILFSFEEKPLGTGGGILNALEMIGDEAFLVMNSDILHNIDLMNLPADIEAAHLIGVSNPDHNPNGDFTINESIVEIKKDHNNLTWSGISIINPIIFRENSFETKTFNMWDTVLPKYISTNKVTGHISSELWIDVGTPERLNLANRVYNDKKLDYE